MDSVKTFLNLLIEQEDGSGLYKIFGGYWELAYPIMQNHAPEELKTYENMFPEDFEYFNPRVNEILTAGDEGKDWKNAVLYYNSRLDSHHTTQDVDYIPDPETGEDIPYLPNQSINVKQHFGREDE